MSREIKFRVWDGLRMTTNGIMFNNSTGCIDVPTGSILMQYTGLEDRNGKEIYEGDVVSFDDDPSGVVEWSEEHCCWLTKQGNTKLSEDEIYDWAQLLKRHSGHYIIHGNIYENPELIKP